MAQLGGMGPTTDMAQSGGMPPPREIAQLGGMGPTAMAQLGGLVGPTPPPHTMVMVFVGFIMQYVESMTCGNVIRKGRKKEK